MKNPKIEAQILNDSNMIVQSIEWIEKEFLKVIEELDKIETSGHPDLEKVLEIEAKITSLVHKLKREDKNVTQFFKKYEKYEEKEKLSNIEKIKQAFNGGVPKNKRGKAGGDKLQE